MADDERTVVTNAEPRLRWLGDRSAVLYALCGGLVGIALAAVMEVSVIAIQAITPNELRIVLPIIGTALGWLAALARHLDD